MPAKKFLDTISLSFSDQFVFTIILNLIDLFSKFLNSIFYKRCRFEKLDLTNIHRQKFLSYIIGIIKEELSLQLERSNNTIY
jgi:hypothetical protein